ncbi:hypothetical protein FB45DRAFT_1036880 [Roridomyces roridus]|uniref:F-box domain-containing protein n=1 Tax=Roridomyces roridus TaxID=1738132 RepID=A0AAD7B7A9_9AGAR|nr:hypothetical protein FB45DRAFT_1036880 [Roridomyces roridus]
MSDFSLGGLSLDDPAPVPYDLLLDIFKLAADDSDLLGRGPLLAISQVCRHWRDSALESPVLWSTFAADARGTISHLQLLQLYLQRSRDLPLSVRLHSRWESEEDPRRPVLVALLTLLAEHSDRLFSLQFTGSWYDIQISEFRGRLPRLEILGLCSISLCESLQFQLAPRLHTLRAEAGCITTGDSGRRRPWELIPCAQIRSLVISQHFSWPTPDDAGLQLEEFSNLTNLKYIIRPGNGSRILSVWGTRSAPFLLPHLTTWCIDYEGPESFFKISELAEMSDHFTIPTLKSLDIIYFADPAHLCSFLYRSGCALTHLTLRRSSIRAGEMLDILEAVPALESLLIDNGYMFQWTKLLDMLQSRVDVGSESKLGLVELVLPRGSVEEEDLMRLKGFVGIHVSVVFVDKTNSVYQEACLKQRRFLLV